MDKPTLKQVLCNCKECISGSFLLKETDSSATLTDVTMCDIPANAMVVKMDKVRFCNFFIDKKEWGYNKHSDYLIVTDDKLVFVEMKSKKQVDKYLSDECSQKFSSDECVLIHADNIISKMMKKTSFFDKLEIHYVLLYEALSMAKTPTSANGVISPNLTPSTFRAIPVVNGGTISYNRAI